MNLIFVEPGTDCGLCIDYFVSFQACDSSEDSKTEEAACCATNLSEDKETSEINDMASIISSALL